MQRGREGTGNRATSMRTIWLIAIGASLLYAIGSVWLLMSYLQPAFDLAIYDQALWLISHGQSLITVSGVAVNAAHFSPILYLISPLSWIPGGATPELVFQGLLIASGVFPAWRLGRRLGQDGRWFALVYAIHPAIIGGSWYGFRPWNLAAPIFMWLTDWIVDDPNWRRVSLAGLSLLVFREDLALWVGLLAVILWIAKRLRTWSLVVSGVVLGAATAIVVLLILPMLSPVDGYLFTDASLVEPASLTEGLASFVSRSIFLLAPLALMPNRLRWTLLLPLAIPAIGLIGRGGNSLTTLYHYDMMFVPLLLLIAGLSTTVNYRPAVLGISSLLVLVVLGALRPFPPQGDGNPFRYDADMVATFDEARSLISSIPDSETTSMSAPTLLVPHYSERSNIFIYPFPVDVWRDSAGNEAPLSIRYTCPEPNIVVARDDSVTSAWRAVLDDAYVSRQLSNGPYSVWVREDFLGSVPCTATRVSTE